MTKVLLFGANPYAMTGFGKVTNQVWNYLRNMGVDTLCFNRTQRGKARDKDELSCLNSTAGEDVLDLYLDYHNIDVMITMLDNWMEQFHYVKDVVTERKKKNPNFKWVCMVTLNTTPMSYKLRDQIKTADYFVAPSQFVFQHIVQEFGLEKCRLIKHGFDPEIFKVHDNETRNVNKIKLGLQSTDPSFLIVAVNNGMNKNMTGIIEAISKVKKYLPSGTKFYFHTVPHTSDGVDLPKCAEIFKVNDICLFPDRISIDNGMDEMQMAKMYNAFDCLISFSSGESFCLPVLESLACGTPVIVLDFSSQADIVREVICHQSRFVRVRAMSMNTGFSYFALGDEQALGAKILNIAELIKEGEINRNRELKLKQYFWAEQNKKWLTLIEECGNNG